MERKEKGVLQLKLTVVCFYRGLGGHCIRCWPTGTVPQAMQLKCSVSAVNSTFTF